MKCKYMRKYRYINIYKYGIDEWEEDRERERERIGTWRILEPKKWEAVCRFAPRVFRIGRLL